MGGLPPQTIEFFLLDKIESDRPLVRSDEKESRKKGSVEKEASEAAAAAARLSPMMVTSAAPPRFILPVDRRNKFCGDNCSAIVWCCAESGFFRFKSHTNLLRGDLTL